MYEHWLKDQEEEYEKLKSTAILVGSFTNPEAARAMINSDSPKHQSSEEEMEESMRMVVEDREKEKKQHCRRRRVING